jgi:hypothetical protein
VPDKEAPRLESLSPAPRTPAQSTGRR